MPDISVEFELFCGGCKAGICNNASEGTTPGRRQKYFTIEPCGKCIADAKEEGIDEGYDKGKSEGYDEGYEAARKEFEKEEAA